MPDESVSGPIPADMVPAGYRAAHAGPHIPSLDGLRAVSIAIVFFSHAGYENAIPGKLGVMVFFVLSGYLITTLLQREARKTGSISLRNFYLRRFWRIVPPLYITIAVVCIIHFARLNPAPISRLNVLTGMTFLANFNGPLAVPTMHDLTPLWSLGVEEHFYLVFPLLYLLVLRKRTPQVQAAILLGICIAVLAWRTYQVFAFHNYNASSGVWIRTDNSVDGILFGCILAVFANPSDEAAHHFEFPKWSWVAGLIGVAICLVWRDPAFRNTARFSIEGASIVPIVYCAVRYADSMPFRLLNWRPLMAVGVGSYTLYLIHLSILDVIGVHHHWPNPAMLPVVAAISGVYAFIAYRLIERPCAEIRRRLSHGKNDVPSPKPG